MHRIVITGMGSITAAGYHEEDISKNYFSDRSFISNRKYIAGILPAATLSPTGENVLEKIRESSHLYKNIDRTVVMAIHASRTAFMHAGWGTGEEVAGISIGSSRGATETYEKRLEAFIAGGKLSTSGYTSPTTTLGNISSWVMQDLNMQGPLISHSMTCSTGLQAIANAVAWLKSGMLNHFLAGAAEAPLTDFTLAQMRALKIYSGGLSEYSCKPFADTGDIANSMVLGEGAAVFALENYKEGTHKEILGEILSIGFGQEKLTSPASISDSGDALYKSMQMAIKNLGSRVEVDMIICHAPGTIYGDEAEINAINKLFGASPPVLLSNKWKLGHTLGASGAISLDYALHILREGRYNDFPYPVRFRNVSRPVKTIMINATGFGGNAVSIVVGKIN